MTASAVYPDASLNDAVFMEMLALLVDFPLSDHEPEPKPRVHAPARPVRSSTGSAARRKIAIDSLRREESQLRRQVDALGRRFATVPHGASRERAAKARRQRKRAEQENEMLHRALEQQTSFLEGLYVVFENAPVLHAIQDGVSTTTALIAEAMEQIKAGTFDPENCKIPGYKSPEQEVRETEERIRRESERKTKETEKKQKEKQDERQQWWNRAKLRFAIERGEEDDDDEEKQDADIAASDKEDAATKWANRVLAAYKARDANDYSVWTNWIPEDPATLEDKAARDAALEQVRNQEFEKNNPDFCQQFKDDLEKRQQSQREKERDAEKSKLVGNRHYKRREYEPAIAQYMKALDKSPFNVAVLTNLAQCFLRLELLDDSVEFSTRALYVNPDHVKALSRRAAVWHRQQKWQQAAEDMGRALHLDPENEDVVEQHSIIVGDYEDSISQSKLQAKLDRSGSDGQGGGAKELRFLTELLNKMDEQDKARENDATKTKTVVSEAWMGYELLVPVLERNLDARELMRTSRELHKLTQRLLSIFEDLSALATQWTNSESDQDEASVSGRVERVTVAAMVQVAAICVASSPRNQIVLYQDTAFRTAVMALLADPDAGKLEVLPSALREMVLRFVEEAIDAKSWKKEVINSPSAIVALLRAIASPPIDKNQANADIDSLTKAVVSASSILLTISGDDPHGIRCLASHSSCIASIADGLQNHRRSTATLTNLLGTLTNLSTNAAVRSLLDRTNAPHADVESLRTRLVRSLLVLSSHFTKPALSLHKRAVYLVCAERALAALLNFSFQPDSHVRTALARQHVLATAHSILGFVDGTNVNELLLVVARTVSLLCRLHVLPDPTNESACSLHREMASKSLLDRLYTICQLSLPALAATSVTAVSAELWQTHAQIWCHVGWCISLPGSQEAIQAYLRAEAALPAMVETVALVNAQRLYRRLSSDTPTGPERITGNVVKVLIAMLPATDSPEKDADSKFWTKKQNLKVLVDALQELPDGLARKNVAIVLAKLCQIFGDAVKTKLRELRGIEMMLSVSKSLQPPGKTTAAATMSNAKAMAF